MIPSKADHEEHLKLWTSYCKRASSVSYVRPFSMTDRLLLKAGIRVQPSFFWNPFVNCLVTTLELWLLALAGWQVPSFEIDFSLDAFIQTLCLSLLCSVPATAYLVYLKNNLAVGTWREFVEQQEKLENSEPS